MVSDLPPFGRARLNFHGFVRDLDHFREIRYNARVRVSTLLVVFSLLLASSSKARPADVVLLPESGSERGETPPERLMFSGGTCPLQWIVRGEIRRSLRKPVCEVFQVTGTTAAPVGELPVAFDAATATGSDIVQLTTSFEAPESDRPNRYLLKVWNETEMQRSLLTMLFIRTLPAGTLDFLKGQTIHAINFESEDRAGWGAFLEEQGATIRWSTEYPKSPEKSDFIFLRADSPSPSEAVDKNSLQAIEVYFEEPTSPINPDTIREKSDGGKQCHTSLEMLRLIETSADSQARLALLLNPASSSR